MGGFGSGRQGWLPVIESGLKLDIRRMRKLGQYQNDVARASGALTWTDTYTGKEVIYVRFSYSSSGSDPWFRLQYTATRDDELIEVDDWFELEPFTQPFGGVRWYFICPSTGKRAQCLYLPPGAIHFRSRQGFKVRLQYASQHYDFISRQTQQMHKLSARMLERWPAELRDKYEDWGFPPKPPGMHWSTYNRLQSKYFRYDELGWIAIDHRMKVLDERLSN